MALKLVPFEVYRQGTAPEPPATLGIHGSKLWRQILTENDIPDTARLTILEQACAAYERADSLRRQIAVDGELIESKAGGIKANPLLMVEITARAGRAADGPAQPRRRAEAQTRQATEAGRRMVERRHSETSTRR